MANRDMMILDGSSMLVRAYFATAYPGRPIRSHNGVFTNAVFGFLNMMFSALNQFSPTHLFVAWDVSRDTFRKSLYPEYKGTRGELPAELLAQFDTMQEVLGAMGIAEYMHEDYEADDIIGSMAEKSKKEGLSVLILTGDKDALQLTSEGIKVGIMRRGMADIDVYTPQQLWDEYGLSPVQMIDVKSLMGDASDNIPGVPGIGAKTATRLIREHGSLEKVLENASSFTGKLRERLETHADLAILCKKLATIALDVPLPHGVDDCRLTIRRDAAMSKLESLNLMHSAELIDKFA